MAPTLSRCYWFWRCYYIRYTYYKEYTMQIHNIHEQDEGLDDKQSHNTSSRKDVKDAQEYDKLIEQLLQQRMIVTNSSTKYEHRLGKHDDLFWTLCLACIAYKDAMSNEFIITSKNSAERRTFMVIIMLYTSKDGDYDERKK